MGSISIPLLVIGVIVAGYLLYPQDQKNETKNNPIAQTATLSAGTIVTSPANTSRRIDRDEAISDHWDEIKDYVNGTESVEACSSESGNCYDLDADITDGAIVRVNFPNTGYLDFSADIDESGEASDSDKDGNNWDFTLDMNSSVIDSAVNEWADANDTTLD